MTRKVHSRMEISLDTYLYWCLGYRWVKIPHRTSHDPRRFIVPKKVKQINDHLFIGTYTYVQTPPWGLSPCCLIYQWIQWVMVPTYRPSGLRTCCPIIDNAGYQSSPDPTGPNCSLIGHWGPIRSFWALLGTTLTQTHWSSRRTRPLHGWVHVIRP